MASKRSFLGALMAGLLTAALWSPGLRAQAELNRTLEGLVDRDRAAVEENPQLVGSWLTTTSVAEFPMSFSSLFTFGRDGTLITSQAALVKGFDGKTLVYSPAHGAWVRTGNRQFDITFVVLIHDENGVLLNTGKVRGTLHVSAGGDDLTGTATAETFDPGGNLTFAFSATLTGSRIDVEAP